MTAKSFMQPLYRNSFLHVHDTADWILSPFMTRCKELDDLPPLSPLQPVSEEEAIQIAAYSPLPLSSSTLADYVDHSETLQKLVQLGKFPTCHTMC